MKKLLYFLCLVPILCWGDSKVTNLSEKVTPAATDYLLITSTGTSQKIQMKNILNFNTPTVNYVPKWNGTSIVWAPYDATFSFSVASFSDSLASVIEIGVGTWKAAGALTFTATYSNGPPTGGYVSHSGWSNLTMTNTYQGPTNSVEAVSYPSVAGNVQFTLNASKSAETSNSTITHYFYNDRHWGVSTKTSGYNSSDVNGLASSDLTNAVATTFTVSPGSGEYIIYAYPSRLGTATFFVGGFEGGFNPPETVSVTNGSGFTENYYVYRSANSNLGSTTVTVQ